MTKRIISRRNFLQGAVLAPSVVLLGDAAKLKAQDLEGAMAHLELVQNGNRRPDATELAIHSELSQYYGLYVTEKSRSGNLIDNAIEFRRRDQHPVEIDPREFTVMSKSRLQDMKTLTDLLAKAQKWKLDISNMTLAFPMGNGTPMSWKFTPKDMDAIRKTAGDRGVINNNTMIINDKAEYVRKVMGRTSFVTQDGVHYGADITVYAISTGMLEKCQKAGSYAALERAFDQAIKPTRQYLA